MTEPQLLLNYTGHLPECPTWSAEENALYWADILEGEIHRYHLPTAEHTVLSFHEEVGCFALRERGGFIVAMRSGIWLSDKHGLLQRKVCDNPSNPQLARFNDGGTDHRGQFYAGTFWAALERQGGICEAVARSELVSPPGAIQPRAAFAFSRDGKRRGELHLLFNRTVRPGAAAVLSVGGEDFLLVTRGNNAWSRGPRQEAARCGRLP